MEVLPTESNGQAAESTRNEDLAAADLTLIGIVLPSRSIGRLCKGTPARSAGRWSFATSVVGQRALHLAIGVTLRDVLAAVVALAPLRERELDLGPTLLEVEGQRDEGQVVLGDLRTEPLDLRRGARAASEVGRPGGRRIRPRARRERCACCGARAPHARRGRTRRPAAPWSREATSPRCRRARGRTRSCRARGSRGARVGSTR